MFDKVVGLLSQIFIVVVSSDARKCNRGAHTYIRYEDQYMPVNGVLAIEG